MKIQETSQTISEELANSISHGAMAIFGIVILILLIIMSHGDGIKLMGALFYSISIIMLFLSSCLYHSITHQTAKNQVFRRFDYISIYLLIGGSYAPILLNLPTLQIPTSIPNIWLGLLIFIIQWILIIIGIIFKSIWIDKLHRLHVLMFLLLGRTALFFMDEIYNFNIGFFWLILSGGLCYTIGVVFYALDKIYFFHFIWHIFVCSGAILHSIGIMLYLY